MVSKTLTVGTPDSRHYLTKTWNTQRPPFHSPMNFSYVGADASGKLQSTDFSIPDQPYGAEGHAAYSFCKGGWDLRDTRINQASNKSYSKLIEQINETSDVANEALFKVSESMDLITNRLVQIANIARALRKKDYSGAAKAAGISKSNFKPKNASKNFGDVWLEYHFGWTNLVNDIYRGMDVMSSKFPTNKPLHARASEAGSESVITAYGHLPNSSYVLREHMEYKVYSVQGCSFSLTNYNLHLVQQLGLANPAAIAWALVPYSFVVDWFVDVQSFILSYTDLVGIELHDSYHTWHAKATSSIDEVHYTSTFDPPDFYRVISYGSGAVSAYSGVRSSGLALPTLTPKRCKAISNVRAATAISLLLGLL